MSDDPAASEQIEAPPPPPFPPGGRLSELARQLAEQQRRLLAEKEAEAAREHAAFQERSERLARLNQELMAAQERMLPGNERIAALQQATAEIQERMWHEQAPYRDRVNALYLESLATEQQRIKDTFDTMFRQTKWAGYMFWITFLLGAALVVVSVATFVLRPDANDPLLGAFFGTGALSMLAFFLRDPADKIQRAGGKLVQLQVAMRYHLLETQYWSTYFNGKQAAGQAVEAQELRRALDQMRGGMQTIMRQIDESLGERRRKPPPPPES